jgi:uncharacterized RDD family membrane protein YckC
VANLVQGWPGGVVGMAPYVEDLDDRWQTGAMVGGAACLIGLDWWVARALFDRQSVGMAVAGIEVVTLDGRRATLARYVLRHLGPKDVVRPLRRLLVGKPSLRWQLAETAAFEAVELAVVLGRGDRRSIGDLVAGTQVVMAR